MTRRGLPAVGAAPAASAMAKSAAPHFEQTDEESQCEDPHFPLLMGSGRPDRAPLRVRNPLQLSLAAASACALLVGCLSWLSHGSLHGTSVEKTMGFYVVHNRSKAGAANASGLLAGTGPANKTSTASCEAGNCTLDLLSSVTRNESGRARGRRDDTARGRKESGSPHMSIMAGYDPDNVSGNASSAKRGARNASNESNASGARSVATNASFPSTHSTGSHSPNSSGEAGSNTSRVVNASEHGDCSCREKFPQCQANDTGSASSDQLEQWVQQYYMAWNNHSTNAVMARFAPNATAKNWSTTLHGAESIGNATQDIFDARPNITVNVLQVYPSPQQMAASARVQIAMRGEDEQHLVEVVDFFRFRSDGAILSLQGSLQEVTNMLSRQVNLIIRELPTNCNDLYIYKLFAPFGAVRDAKAILAEDGTCTGVGLVAFMRASDAARAIEHLDRLKQQDGTHMRVSVNDHPPREDTPKELVE